MPHPLSDSLLHRFSQLVYLDSPAPTQASPASVASLAGYYLHDPVGVAYIRSRFGNIPSEYRRWLLFLQECSELCGGWQIVDVLDDNAPRQSGFYACTYWNGSDIAVAAFRGSEILGDPRYKNDYATDLALSYETTTAQHRMANTYWQKYGRRTGDLYVTGHSLGGNLAVYAAVAAPGAVAARLRRCTIFNAPGFNREFLGEYAAGIAAVKSRLVHYQNEFDPVSSLLVQPMDSRIVQSAYDPGEEAVPTALHLFLPHSNFLYRTGETGEFLLREDGRKSELCDLLHLFTLSFLDLPAKHRRRISRLVLEGIFHAPGLVNPKQAVLEAVLRYLTRLPAPESASASGLTATAYGAHLLGPRLDLPALYTLASGPAEPHPDEPRLSWALLILLELLYDT